MAERLCRRAALAGLVASAVAGCNPPHYDPIGGPMPPLPPLPPSPPPPAPTAPEFVEAPQVSDASALKWSDLVVDTLLADSAANPPGLSPMEQSRILAMAFIAGHDALNGIHRVYEPYLPNGNRDPLLSPSCTYETAVCFVLEALLPAHAATFRQVLMKSYADAGIYFYSNELDAGQEAAGRMLSHRSTDGSAAAQGPYVPGGLPGDYQPTPPVNAATFSNWGAVSAFAMTSGSQFRAPAPYAISSADYAQDYQEVKSLGAASGSGRTEEQTHIARFWLESTPLSWQRIASGCVRQDPAAHTLWSTARLFARLQISQADAYIASLDSKYHHRFWRPVTAVHAGDDDGNSLTVGDPYWQPLDPVTPPVPEYPSAHAAAGAAGAVILFRHLPTVGQVFHESSTDTAPRLFVSPSYFPDDAEPGKDLFARIAQEIGLSRIYVGYHFRLAVTAGLDQGRAVGERVIATALGPVNKA